MNKIAVIFTGALLLSALAAVPSCNTICVDEVLLQTIKMDLQVNDDNLGISPLEPKNAVDTIRSEINQFYNYPEFRRLGMRVIPKQKWTLITSAYAQSDCPEQEDYISRMDPSKTIFSLDVSYDASAVGLGTVNAGTNLLSVEEISEAFLNDFTDNVFLNGGAPTPLTIAPGFFRPINGQWITFHFTFEEIDGTLFTDSTYAYIDLEF
jgi:hypothetical protein